MVTPLFVLLVVVVAGARAGPAPRWRAGASEAARLTALLEAAAQCHNITGWTIEVTDTAGPLYRNAGGVRDVASRAPVDNNTLFGIGSTTKAFTSTLVAMLQDEGKLPAFFARVGSLLGPGWGLNDPWMSAHVTLQDLASHRTGIPRNDFVWLSGLPPGANEIGDNLYRFAHWPSALDFRQGFLYNNWMVAALGEVAARAANTTWQSLVAARLLGPLGMSATKVSVAAAVATQNYAIPVAREPSGAVVQLPVAINALLEPVAPAGILSSTAEDMGKWIRLHMNHGAPSPGAAPLVNASTLGATYVPHNVLGPIGQIAEPVFPGSLMQWGYGAGWFLGSEDGAVWVSHGGDSIGHHSIVSLTHSVGVFFSGYGPDGGAATIRNEIAEFASDLYSGREPWLNATTICSFPGPWVPPHATGKTRQGTARAAPDPRAPLPGESGPLASVQEAARQARSLVRAGKLPLPVSAYSGTYTNPGYGKLELLASPGVGSGLWLRYNSFACNLTATASPATLLATPFTSPYTLLFPGGVAVLLGLQPAAGSTPTVANITAPFMSTVVPPVFDRAQ